MLGRWEHLTLECLLSIVSASKQAQGHMQSKDVEQNTLLVWFSLLTLLSHRYVCMHLSHLPCTHLCWHALHQDVCKCISLAFSQHSASSLAHSMLRMMNIQKLTCTLATLQCMTYPEQG